MSKPTLQEQLRRKLKETNNEMLVAGIHQLLESNVSYQKTVTLSASEKNRLIQSKQEIERGEFMDNESHQANINQWLSE
ncbi:MAG: hypothetical protein ACR2IL_02775 [Chitinophagaceae bacterium]